MSRSKCLIPRIYSLGLSQRGQATAEYALVLLVAAVMVGVFAAFVKSGSLDEMFQSIISGLVESAGG